MVDLKRLPAFEALAGNIVKTARADFSAGGAGDSGSFLSRAVAHDLANLISTAIASQK